MTNRINRKLLLFLFLSGILLIIAGATFFVYFLPLENRIIVRIHFDVDFVGDSPTYGAVHDGNLTISNVGRVDIHNVFVEYTSWGSEWNPPEKKVFFGNISNGENKTAFVENFYIPRDSPYVRYPIFHIVMDEGYIQISTDEFMDKDWILQ